MRLRIFCSFVAFVLFLPLLAVRARADGILCQSFEKPCGSGLVDGYQCSDQHHQRERGRLVGGKVLMR